MVHAVVGNKVIVDFRNQMFPQRLIKFASAYFDQSTIGTLLSKVTNDDWRQGCNDHRTERDGKRRHHL
jgi:hypothetical protein